METTMCDNRIGSEITKRDYSVVLGYANVLCRFYAPYGALEVLTNQNSNMVCGIASIYSTILLGYTTIGDTKP